MSKVRSGNLVNDHRLPSGGSAKAQRHYQTINLCNLWESVDLLSMDASIRSKHNSTF